ncbi:glycosyl transferase group 1 [Haloterrigena turkmenica DSM 5511]|uniref:Glycosyl transferase group 1 n=1 Tax=Haloterrigena turkmenica (strain ATCC 51198 / DSM 5511 / JCM 9101 / NCIMB 13204 / VKM B-1734 / 4k) TaxID=543526 RepID=D2RWY6_HALTV|nr:glycosyltransferase [Haloterrigena turkmenica]ADB59598.1 glycosyl transferase group 1 [Haloterrigena turkmenica DSM 5511]
MAKTNVVAAFTDLYRPTVNGVTYTVALWRERWTRRRGSMAIVFPEMDGYEPGDGEYALPSVGAPLYPRYRLGVPVAPDGLDTPDIVHVHTPFTVGFAGVRFARERDVPVVATYHTLLEDRVNQHVPDGAVEPLKRVCRAYERAFFERVDHVTVPTSFARWHLLERVGADIDATIVSNGIDVDFFRPVESTPVRERYGLSGEGPLLGYTGRHGPEKNLEEAIDAVDGTDWTLVIAGDGPARDDLEGRAAATDADVRFLGFLEREELPAFYSALDAFVFPSPVETQGLVALEATACGTPVVAADAGALADGVIEGETGYRYAPGDREAFRWAIRRTLAERERLSDLCRRRRDMLAVDHSLEQLAALYDAVRDD